MKKLGESFYNRSDVVQITKDLLGKKIHTLSQEGLTAGRITEVEAYSGENDKACHANNGVRTSRTEVMYHEGGKAYVYLCYGIHHLFNVVTNVEGRADAVLIRAIEPIDGIELMMSRRGRSKMDKALTSGPGTLSQALGIKTKDHYGSSLLGNQIWIEEAPALTSAQIVVSTRIGVAYAEEDALKPWRFYIKDNPWVSKK